MLSYFSISYCCEPNWAPGAWDYTKGSFKAEPCTLSVNPFLFLVVAYLSWSVGPSKVGEVRVHRHAHHLAVDVVELTGLVAE